PGTHSNHGLAWFSDWGPNRYALSSAYLANLRAEAASFEGHFAYSEDLTQFATDQLDYILGDNPLSQSYVTGFGPKYPRFPHHRGASGAKTVTDAKENRHSLPGALVGGPHKDGSYSDNRENYRQNEVATDYNAALVAALAARLGR
ncbi:MAG: glycoside hydrolase family 9 protein, partial [Mangrovicoccus sp.]